MINHRLLGIYLNDHLAGVVAAIELGKRSHGSNESSRYGAPLASLREELENDRRVLEDLMSSLLIPKATWKQAAGWTAEKIGRIKLNGQIRGYSPLSRVVELEGLGVSVEAKLLMWQNLKRISDSDSRLSAIDFDTLIKKSEAQREEIRHLLIDASEEALVERLGAPED